MTVQTDSLPTFDDPALARKVEALGAEAVDHLPFGSIRLDDYGVVRYYSQAERRLSGSGDLTRLGGKFFTEIAPCMDNDAYRGRIEAARKGGKLNLEFSHIGDFEDRDRELTVRVQSAADGGVWIFMRRDS
jgi:photoactive yellow protein